MNIVEKYSHCQQMRIFFTPLLLTKRLFLLGQIPQSEFMPWRHVYQAVSHGVKTNVFHPSLLLRQSALWSWERLFQAFRWYVPDFNLEKLFTYNNNVLWKILPIYCNIVLQYIGRIFQFFIPLWLSSFQSQVDQHWKWLPCTTILYRPRVLKPACNLARVVFIV